MPPSARFSQNFSVRRGYHDGRIRGIDLMRDVYLRFEYFYDVLLAVSMAPTSQETEPSANLARFTRTITVWQARPQSPRLVQ